MTQDTNERFERRFGGLRRLYGVDGAQRIFDAHVVVVGIGGVGSWAVEALARSGVRRLTLIDLDHVSESNINRQIHALEPTLGQAKADGTWVLPNIPANFGSLRARATCVQGGVTTYGESAGFTIPPNGSVTLPPIVIGPTTPIPTALRLIAPSTTLTRRRWPASPWPRAG